jgi:uncharacterized protein
MNLSGESHSPQSEIAFHLMAKPIGPLCNIRCEYCFYLAKEQLYPSKINRSHFTMSDETLDHYIKSYIVSQPEHVSEIYFAWQGGEPTLLGVRFFEKALELQKKYCPPGKTIHNAFQTNGILIGQDLAKFFKDNHFLVGVSIDGPEHLHNRYRVDRAGQGTFKDVMKGIEVLKQYNVDFNTLTVVQEDNSQYPLQVYDFLTNLGSTFLQFIPIVESDSKSQVSSRTVPADRWGSFLTGIFHRWRTKDIGTIFVQYFDMLLGIYMGYPASLCVHSKECGRALALEHNGDVYSCDHFVNPDYYLGNIHQDLLANLVDSNKQREFGTDKFSSLPDKCRSCDYLNLCYGACPKDRLIQTKSGKLNWLCSGYQSFYRETKPFFLAFKECLIRGVSLQNYQRYF